MKQNIKNVVLVHGAFADGSGWEAVANILKNDGYKVSVVQHPETSYADDQKYTKDDGETRQRQDGRSEFQPCGLHVSSGGISKAHRRGCYVRVSHGSSLKSVGASADSSKTGGGPDEHRLRRRTQ